MHKYPTKLNLFSYSELAVRIKIFDHINNCNLQYHASKATDNASKQLHHPFTIDMQCKSGYLA